MSEELKIEVDVKANDDNAKKTLNNLIKEYDKKSLDLDVKFGKLDINNLHVDNNIWKKWSIVRGE